MPAANAVKQLIYSRFFKSDCGQKQVRPEKDRISQSRDRLKIEQVFDATNIIRDFAQHMGCDA